jgi:Flp pilus assembly protein TadB
MSSLDPQVPPAGEEIHLPGPTLQPLLLTVGVTVGLIGVTTWWILWVIGAIITGAVLIRWIMDCRRDIAELPLEHDAHH